MGPEFLGYVWGSRGGPPAQVAGLAVTPASTSALNLIWNVLSPAPDSYLIEESADGSTGWATVGSTSSPSFSDTGLTPGAHRFYRVSAINSRGTGPVSAVVGAYTLAELMFNLSPNSMYLAL